MCECGNKDQTPKEAVELIKGKLKGSPDSRVSDIVGTGLFRIPYPEAGVLSYQTIAVFDLHYEECRKRGAHCKAFKFLPDEFVSKAEVEKFLAKSRDEQARDCFQFCGAAGLNCPPLCFCGESSNFCQ